MASDKPFPDETIRLDALPEPPLVIHYTLSRGERIRRYGRDEDVPLHVGDVLAVDRDQRIVKITSIIDSHTVTVRPYPNEDEAREIAAERKRFAGDH